MNTTRGLVTESLNQVNQINSVETGIDPVLIQKMVFVYNALNDGWEVKKKGENKYIFTKNLEKESEEIKREINLDDYLRKFLKFHLDIENLTTTRRSGSI